MQTVETLCFCSLPVVAGGQNFSNQTLRREQEPWWFQPATSPLPAERSCLCQGDSEQSFGFVEAEQDQACH